MKKLLISSVLVGVLAMGGASQEAPRSSGFVFEPDTPHKVMLVLQAGWSDEPEARAAVARYLYEHYRAEKLELHQFQLGRERNLAVLVIQPFDSAQEALTFREWMLERNPDFLQMGITAWTAVISDENFLRLAQEPRLDAYRRFFRQHFLD
ncbi:MAG: hypothetical protein D6765_08055 [Bacteroidetes bacterium]|nr:MAG: hypothetical protein D6765_08055 [Bacteroidota bacterium]